MSRHIASPPYELRSALFWANEKVFEKYTSGKTPRNVRRMLDFAQDIFKLHGFHYKPYPEFIKEKKDFLKDFVLDFNQQIEVNRGDVNDFIKKIRQIYTLRQKCFLKYRDDKPIKLPSRIPIIFCEYNYTQKELEDDKMDIEIGITINGTAINDEYDKPMPKWLPFIVINLNNQFDDFYFNYVAHEMIHAAGHLHPEKGGGYSDGGSKYDIMNYNSWKYKPSHIYIRPAHVELLKHSYFSGKL